MGSPLPIARPWTPPSDTGDMAADSSPHSDYFSDPFRPPSHYSSRVEKRWPLSPSRPGTPSQMKQRCDTPTEQHDQRRPKAVGRLTEPAPYTPTKNLIYGHGQQDGALRYPYTPDSSRMLRRSTEIPASPEAWDTYSEHSSSPVQDALSSCIAHFENLIHSQQPDEDQMEFIVRQFEAMTSYLSAPDAQSRQTDDHLFSEDALTPGTGLGISEPDARNAKLGYISNEAHDAYVTHVGTYIAGVKKYIEDLKMRLDEVKTLNSIQLDVITDLRRQMKTVRRDMRSTLDMRDDINMVEEELERIAAAETRQPEFGLDSWVTLVDEDRGIPQFDGADEKVVTAPKADVEAPPKSRRRVITIVHKPERRSFWASFGSALDSFGALIHEQ
ncbi:hypothetical protein HBI56_077440 [Parastagonospora nodorum]|uniref:Uncharacterized protein n=2 Tax=Phaeosphaeria nodorum (strain SN15 / ATCC MYA-4574 / FGSC 10173) TaxID=321614 RepID=A0A7U2HZW4_PHANO|nr:hypothetical protein HBH56_149750 [Parastagonospora nodorum]QRC94212.1 hypothetical protein JI435_074800 [Parastagonospora nodorum SN15]KAH3928349.1 hypothetical protein HBH54_135650 [Parastagonospora nodorum]KAH3946062.1 hypothetical protein HBH53_137200 [Parastagonospora nodorum]KAH3984015.1 hypothetical protein HBH52_062810 [Parastagonospora nodorum]